MLRHPVITEFSMSKANEGVRRPAIRKVLEDDVIGVSDDLYRRFFNNKMTLVIFLIQSRSVDPDEKWSRSSRAFLDEVFRCRLNPALQKRYRLVFLWLNRFLMRLPRVSDGQRDKAMGFVKVIYELMGIPFKMDRERTLR